MDNKKTLENAKELLPGISAETFAKMFLLKYNKQKSLSICKKAKKPDEPA